MADHVTSALAQLWAALHAGDPLLELGGIYASKPGYHNSRVGNRSIDYSVRDRQDKLGPPDKAAAIDVTFPEAQRGNYTRIAAYCQRLWTNVDHPALNGMLREWYGQADFDEEVEGWDFRYKRVVTSDRSHLWHIHLSFNRGQVENLPGMMAVAAILLGRDVQEGEGADMLDLKHGAKGERVRALQLVLERLGKRPDGGADGDYGDSTAKKVAELVGGDGKWINAGTYVELLARLGRT